MLSRIIVREYYPAVAQRAQRAFATAMVAFFAGLLTFLREILLATATVRIGLQNLPTAIDAPSRQAALAAKGAQPEDA